jgi:hypothetical protein
VKILALYGSNFQNPDNNETKHYLSVRNSANPIIASYNGTVLNYNNATGSLARFEKNIILYYTFT